MSTATMGRPVWTGSERADAPHTGAAERELGALCARLEGDTPVSPRGVALARLLLADPASPVDVSTSTEDLVDAVTAALIALDLPQL